MKLTKGHFRKQLNFFDFFSDAAITVKSNKDQKSVSSEIKNAKIYLKIELDRLCKNYEECFNDKGEIDYNKLVLFLEDLAFSANAELITDFDNNIQFKNKPATVLFFLFFEILNAAVLNQNQQNHTQHLKAVLPHLKINAPDSKQIAANEEKVKSNNESIVKLQQYLKGRSQICLPKTTRRKENIVALLIFRINLCHTERDYLHLMIIMMKMSRVDFIAETMDESSLQCCMLDIFNSILNKIQFKPDSIVELHQQIAREKMIHENYFRVDEYLKWLNHKFPIAPNTIDAIIKIMKYSVDRLGSEKVKGQFDDYMKRVKEVVTNKILSVVDGNKIVAAFNDFQIRAGRSKDKQLPLFLDNDNDFLISSNPYLGSGIELSQYSKPLITSTTAVSAGDTKDIKSAAPPQNNKQ